MSERKKRYSYTDFDRYDGKITGRYFFVEKGYGERVDYFDTSTIFDDPEMKQEVFFEYDLRNKTGYYMYPINDTQDFKIELSNLSGLNKVIELRKVVYYDKSLKHTDNIMHKLSKDLSVPIIIRGDMIENIVITDSSVSIKDHFLIELRENTWKFRNAYYSDTILTELQLLNEIKDVGKYDLSKQTEFFFNNYINNLIDKGIQADKYKNIIETFQDMIDNPVSETKWQEFILANYRYMFPEYLIIDKERELTTIDEDKKYVDFILENQTTSLLLEIKLPTQKIMSVSKDRNNHYFVAAVNKSIFQIQRYYNSFKHELANDNKDRNVKAILLIGWEVESLDESDKINNDFEMARAMYKDIEIFTYSELLNKIKNIYKLLRD